MISNNWMTHAIEASKNGNTKIGAAVVRRYLTEHMQYRDELISTGHNMTHVNVLTHAEIHAIHNVPNMDTRVRLENCIIYTTLEPCPMCYWAGAVARVLGFIYMEEDPRFGAKSIGAHLGGKPFIEKQKPFGLNYPAMLKFKEVINTLKFFDVHFAFGGGMLAAERHRERTTEDMDIHIKDASDLCLAVEHFIEKGWNVLPYAEVDDLSGLIRMVKGGAEVDFIIDNKVPIDYFEDAERIKLYGEEVLMISDMKLALTKMGYPERPHDKEKRIKIFEKVNQEELMELFRCTYK